MALWHSPNNSALAPWQCACRWPLPAASCARKCWAPGCSSQCIQPRCAKVLASLLLRGVCRAPHGLALARLWADHRAGQSKTGVFGSLGRRSRRRAARGVRPLALGVFDLRLFPGRRCVALRSGHRMLSALKGPQVCGILHTVLQLKIFTCAACTALAHLITTHASERIFRCTGLMSLALLRILATSACPELRLTGALFDCYRVARH